MAQATTTNLISREQYDLLVTNAPKLMQGEYQRTKREWTLGGVRITATSEFFQAMYTELEWAYTAAK